MNVWAIVPVKPFRDSKSRLAHILSADQRAELTSDMAQLIQATQRAAADAQQDYLKRVAVLVRNDYETRIAVLDNGRIVQSGTHAELLQISPLYQRMVSAYGDAT